jgi:hypothetical protein
MAHSIFSPFLFHLIFAVIKKSGKKETKTKLLDTAFENNGKKLCTSGRKTVEPTVEI